MPRVHPIAKKLQLHRNLGVRINAEATRALQKRGAIQDGVVETENGIPSTRNGA
jgi:hypothetical protein